MIVKLRSKELKNALRIIRTTIGCVGIVVVLGAAGTSDTNPSMPTEKLFVMAVGGVIAAYWGFHPYMRDR